MTPEEQEREEFLRILDLLIGLCDSLMPFEERFLNHDIEWHGRIGTNGHTIHRNPR